MKNYFCSLVFLIFYGLVIQGQSFNNSSNVNCNNTKKITENLLNVNHSVNMSTQNQNFKLKNNSKFKRIKKYLDPSNFPPQFDNTINRDAKSSIENGNFLEKNNYEEVNVSVVVDSEAGSIILKDFNGGSYRYKGLTTSEKPEYDSLYSDYEESNNMYEDVTQRLKNGNSNSLIQKFETAESLWSIFDMFNTIWSNYSKFHNEGKFKREANINSTELIEGRYIKGDPLKGYYDFVITEGSYKFWAAFQLATAVLIIYSTFAAIYYSKVNPLVGDYDYVDYLGGGRLFSDDNDFVDSTQDNDLSKYSENMFDGNFSNISSAVMNSNFNNWLPKLKYSLNFILSAVDKLPVRD